MANVRLFGETSGFVQLAAPDAAGNNTITLPTTGTELVAADATGSTTIAGTATISGLIIDGTATFAVGASGTPAIAASGDANTGIYFPTADTIGFAEGGNEVARIDSSGRLLVGVTSGSHPLSVVNSQSSKIQFGQASDQGGFLFSDAAGGFGISGGGYFNGSNWIAKSTTSSHIRDDGDGNIRMFNNVSLTAGNTFTPTEHMRFRSNGGFIAFNPGTSSTVDAVTTQSAGTTHAYFSGVHSATGPTTGGTVSLRIWTNGDIQNTNGSYTQLSDAKLKENIVDAESQWDDLKAVRIRNWNFKEETGHETYRQIGPVAQELEQVCPNLVYDVADFDEDGNDLGTTTKSVRQSVLYMKAVKALQEAMERIETLEQRLSDAGIA